MKTYKSICITYKYADKDRWNCTQKVVSWDVAYYSTLVNDFINEWVWENIQIENIIILD